MESSCERHINYSIKLKPKPLESEAFWSREKDTNVQYEKLTLEGAYGTPPEAKSLTEAPGDFDVDD